MSEWHDQFPPLWTPEEQRKAIKQWAVEGEMDRRMKELQDWAASSNPLGCIGHCDPRLIDDKDERETNP